MMIKTGSDKRKTVDGEAENEKEDNVGIFDRVIANLQGREYDPASREIPINIWDDYYDDDCVPDGQVQETYAYVEDEDISLDDGRMYLEKLFTYIADNIELPGVSMELCFYDAEDEYPELVGTDNDWLLFERWEIRFEGLTHELRYELMDCLLEADLSFAGVPFNIYSES